MAHGGLGRPRESRAPRAVLGLPAGFLWKGVSAEHVSEERDRVKAEAGQRLADLVARRAPADIFDDLWRLATEVFDDHLEILLDADQVGADLLLLELGALRGLRNFIARLDKKLALGAAAMQRLAEKRLASAETIAGRAVRDEE